MKWVAHVGHLDVEFVMRRDLSWREAVKVLESEFRQFEGDPCMVCRTAAMTGLSLLAEAAPEKPVSWEVDGDEYVIHPQQGRNGCSLASCGWRVTS